jgi:hypothetical protein
MRTTPPFCTYNARKHMQFPFLMELIALWRACKSTNRPIFWQSTNPGDWECWLGGGVSYELLLELLRHVDSKIKMENNAHSQSACTLWQFENFACHPYTTSQNFPQMTKLHWNFSSLLSIHISLTANLRESNKFALNISISMEVQSNEFPLSCWWNSFCWDSICYWVP